MVPTDDKIPLHTRFGLRLLQLLLVILALFLVKRCVMLYYDNKTTDRQIQQELYDKGYTNGMNKALGLSAKPEPPFRNDSVKKAYRDGFRSGWDKGRLSRQTDSTR